MTGTEWPPTTPPWLYEQGRERGEERRGTGEWEGTLNNPAAGSPKYRAKAVPKTDSDRLTDSTVLRGERSTSAHAHGEPEDARAVAAEARSDAMRRRKNCPSALPQERTQRDWPRGWGEPLEGVCVCEAGGGGGG